MAAVRPDRVGRAAVRWHGRLELEAPPLSLTEWQLAPAALASLFGGGVVVKRVILGGTAKGGGVRGVYRDVAIYSRSKEEPAVKKILALAIVALVVPSVALAGKPADPGKPSAPGKSQDTHGNAQSASHAPKVLYVLKGVLTAYTAAPDGSACPTSGSITIAVSRANHHRAAFESLTQPLLLSFCVDPKTKIVVKDGGDLTVGDKGIVKVRYAKKFDPTDTAQLTDFQAAVAKQVIDQGPVTPTS